MHQNNSTGHLLRQYSLNCGNWTCLEKKMKALMSESHLGADLRKLGLDSEVVDRSTINDTFLFAWLGFSCDGSKIERVVLNV